MNNGHDRGRLDWLVELAGSVVPATAAAYAAVKLEPASGLPLPEALLAGFGVVFALSYAAMRAVPAEPCRLALPEFEPLVAEDAGFDNTLLLDQPWQAMPELLLDRPLAESDCQAAAELLLDDPLPAAAPDSRVVQLFAAGRMPTAGQLKSRIDRHLANAPRTDNEPQADASDALTEALAELRRSLRQA